MMRRHRKCGGSSKSKDTSSSSKCGSSKKEQTDEKVEATVEDFDAEPGQSR